MIPDFVDDTGYLPAGVHDATFQQVQQRFGYNMRRVRLLDGLRNVLRQLFEAGIEEVYLGGSFVTKAPLPNDIDGYWVYRKGIDISKIDPVILSMDVVAMDPFSGRFVRAVKMRYGVELFMDSPNSKIEGKTCREFFSCSRDGEPRGVIRIGKEGGL